MSDFIREVDEDYRRDRALEFWKTYGWMILLGIGIIVLAVAAYSYYENAKQQKLEAQATAYVVADQLMVRGQSADAASRFQTMLSGDLSPGYRALASFRLAEIRQAGGDTQQAVGIYDSVSNNEALPTVFRDLATLTSTSLLLDELTSDETIERLSPLTLGSDFQYSASEMIGISLLRQGAKAEAVPYFRQILQAETAPQTMRARAQTLLSSIDDGSDVLPDVSGAVIEKDEDALLDAASDEALQ